MNGLKSFELRPLFKSNICHKWKDDEGGHLKEERHQKQRERGAQTGSPGCAGQVRSSMLAPKLHVLQSPDLFQAKHPPSPACPVYKLGTPDPAEDALIRNSYECSLRAQPS